MKKIKDIESFSFDLLNKSENISDYDENMKENMIFKKYCVYFDNYLLENFLNEDKTDGLLVVFDYHLSNDEITVLR